MSGLLTRAPAQVNQNYMLTLEFEGSGSIYPVAGDYMYPQGTRVQVTATSSPGWSFDHWQLDGKNVGSINPFTAVMNDTHILNAVFTQNLHILTVFGFGQGSFSMSPSGGRYVNGTVVMLTATPAAGSTFSGWGGDLTGSTNPTTITMDSDKKVIATFSQAMYTLSIQPSDGSGSINPMTGNYTYSSGSIVKVTATPSSEWRLDHWVLDGSNVGSTNPFAITMNDGHTLSAVFTQNQCTLIMNISGQGSVITSPNQQNYTHGSNVQLTAKPSIGWIFVGWSGDASSTANPLSVTMDGNKVVTATFTQIMYALMMSTSGQGSISKSPGQSTYTYGSMVQLTATPASGWLFSHWLLDDAVSSSSNPFTVTMNATHTVKAIFTQTEDEWATVFYQDYSQESSVPANINSYSYNQPPTITISKVDDYIRITKTASSYHIAHVYGFTNQIKCRYTIELEWTNAGVYLMVGGVSLYCSKSGSNYYICGKYEDYTDHEYYPYPFQWNIGKNSHITLVIDTDTKGMNADGTEGNAYISAINSSGTTFGPSLLIHADYIRRLDFGANLFTSNTLGISPDATTSVKLFQVRQEVQAPSLVTAIGSNKYQAYGYDGPHTYSTVGAGMNEITAAGMGGTIFADVEGYIDSTYLAYLKTLLNAGTGWDLGIHFTEYWDPDTGHPKGYTFNQKIVNMNRDYATLAQMFGEPPLTWCALGHANTAEEAQWAKTNLNLIDRAWRVIPENFGGAQDITTNNIEFWQNAANAGYATLPIYAHETEPNPANDPSASVSGSLFDTWLTTIIAKGVRLIGYYGWYMIQSNQIDAKFSTSTFGSDTTITADTNGYNAIILVKINADSVAAVKRGNQIIDYSESPDGYIVFEVEDGGKYIVTTKTIQTQYTLTIQQPDGSGSTTPAAGGYTYGQGSSAQVTATPSSGWLFSHWLLDGANSGSSNPTTVVMDAAHTLKPVFVQGSYSFTVQASGGAYVTTQDGATLYSGSSAYQAIQTALNTAKYGDTILIKAGNYPINSQLTGKSGVSLKGEGMPVLDFSSQTAYATLITEYGSTTGTYYPAANLVKGQTTITTTTSSGASVGSLIYVKSTAVWRSNSMGNLQGEIRRITAVSGNTLTLEASLEDSYSKSVTTITKVNPVKDITVDGIKFYNSKCAYYTNGVTRKLFKGFWFKYGDNIHITNCVFDGIEDTAIRFDDTINSRIDHNTFLDATMDGAGYGVGLAYACQNMVIEYNHAERCRHWVVAGDGGSSPGIPRHITVQNNYSKDSIYWIPSNQSWGTQNQYDCHPVGEDINFLYNEATGAGYGLYYQAYSGSIIGNNFHDISYGIGIGIAYGWVGSDGLTHYQDSVIVQNNTITNCSLWGIETGNENPRHATNIQVLRNIISGCPVVGITMFYSSDCIVSNNIITGVTAKGDIGIKMDSTTSNIQGSGNVITGCTTAISNSGSENSVS